MQDIRSEDIVVVSKLRKTYKLEDGREVSVLRNITLDRTVESIPIQRGEFVMIRGPSGSGKTRYDRFTIYHKFNEHHWNN